MTEGPKIAEVSGADAGCATGNISFHDFCAGHQLQKLPLI
jgi:hypothetical protein